MTTAHEHFQARLNDYVDDELPVAQRAEVHRHLESCDPCLAEVEAMLLLRAEARTLPREIAPTRDLWPEIRARIDAASPSVPAETSVIAVDFQAPARRPAVRRWGGMMAASVALVVLSSGVTAYFLRQPGTSAAVPITAVQAKAPAEGPVGLAAFQPGQVEYQSAVEALSAELDARRGQLAPETIATIEGNLRIIDLAIAEARAALAADPSNPEIPHLLSGVYRKKVELLQDAVRLQTQS